MWIVPHSRHWNAHFDSLATDCEALSAGASTTVCPSFVTAITDGSNGVSNWYAIVCGNSRFRFCRVDRRFQSLGLRPVCEVSDDSQADLNQIMRRPSIIEFTSSSAYLSCSDLVRSVDSRRRSRVLTKVCQWNEMVQRTNARSW